MNSWLAVGIGAACGAWLRWRLGLWLNPLVPELPLGTLAANLLGGYLIGIVLGLAAQFETLPQALRLFVTVGFLGGFTTFSAFSAETTGLFARGLYAWGFAVIGAHVGGSLGCTALGIMTIKWAART